VQSKEVFEDPSKISGYYPKFFEILKQATNIPGNRFVLYNLYETLAFLLKSSEIYIQDISGIYLIKLYTSPCIKR
jgi:hypothetical protein